MILRLPSPANDNLSPDQQREAAGKRVYLRAEFETPGLVSRDWESLNTVERRRWVELAAAIA